MGALTTELCRRLGIERPVLQAGMGMGARHELAAAVSEAGGLGVLGGAPLAPEELRDEIRAVRARTDRPFGVDLLFPPQFVNDDDPTIQRLREAVEALSPAERDAMPELAALSRPGHVDDQVQVCLEEGVPVLVAGLGSPVPYLDALHDAGVFVMSMAGKADHAVRHQADGVDAIIASGADGGGHVGSMGSLSLWRACLDAVDLPVVGGGGVGDGSTMLAALATGCGAVWIGTRFLATQEARIHAAAKQKLVETRADDTVVTRAVSGKPMRVVRNAWVDSWRGRESELQPFPLQAFASNSRGAWAFKEGDVVEGVVIAGSSAGLIRDVPSAGEVVRRICDEASDALERLSSELG